jgi:post-segregation antitoxin (ccd killing protein)
MNRVMQVTVNIPEEMAQQARARGVAVEAYVEEVLVRESQHSAPKDLRVVGEAIDRLRELRQGNTLGGSKIKDLIDEGRKY